MILGITKQERADTKGSRISATCKDANKTYRKVIFYSHGYSSEQNQRQRDDALMEVLVIRDNEPLKAEPFQIVARRLWR